MADGSIHSTGRGGAGNIGRDETLYTDGGIVREGVVGESSASEYSSGRGGAGNIVDHPKVIPAASEEYVPEPSLRSTGNYENFHTGRGGGGNVYKEKYGGHSSPPKDHTGEKEGLGDKVKNLLGLNKK